MKRMIYLLAGIMVLSPTVFSDAPQSFNYQAVARDNSGEPLDSQNIALRISILKGSTSGTTVYSETHGATTSHAGLLSLAIGKGTVVSGDFTAIDWGTDSYFMKVEMDETGGTTYKEMGTSQLLSVPYALYASSAGNVLVQDTSETNELQNLSVSETGDTLYLSQGNSVIIPGISSGNYRLPTVTTDNVTNISDTTAQCGGNVTDGGYPNVPFVTARGICWSTTTQPTTSDNKINVGINFGSFSRTMTGLTPGITYNVRAYGTNSQGTAYGVARQFTTTGSLTIGYNFAGGIVFHIDGTGQHGLVAAPSDQHTDIQWYNGTYTVTGATRTAVGEGDWNTDRIVSNQGSGSYAAKICQDLSLNGYTDWYLPSKDELNLMFTNLKQNGYGGFTTNDYYWSSTEDNNTSAWIQYFDNGNQVTFGKYEGFRVRAVRAF